MSLDSGLRREVRTGNPGVRMRWEFGTPNPRSREWGAGRPDLWSEGPMGSLGTQTRQDPGPPVTPFPGFSPSRSGGSTVRAGVGWPRVPGEGTAGRALGIETAARKMGRRRVAGGFPWSLSSVPPTPGRGHGPRAPSCPTPLVCQLPRLRYGAARQGEVGGQRGRGAGRGGSQGLD